MSSALEIKIEQVSSQGNEIKQHNFNSNKFEISHVGISEPLTRQSTST